MKLRVFKILYFFVCGDWLIVREEHDCKCNEWKRISQQHYENNYEKKVFYACAHTHMYMCEDVGIQMMMLTEFTDMLTLAFYCCDCCDKMKRKNTTE